MHCPFFLLVMTVIMLDSSSSLQQQQQQVEQRCNASKLGRAAGSQSLETLQQALEGWTTEELDALPGKNPLHMAAWQGCLENVQYLVQQVGCQVNAISTAEFSYGKTAIFFAATRCRNDVVLYLLEQGAHVTIVNNKGQSVRSIASSHLLPHVMERICQHESSSSFSSEWTNYRATHSDYLEYGDLDPRFLDRPLRETDVVTEHAVNPTTKQSRQGSFLRKNPHLRTSTDDAKQKKKKEDNRKPRRNKAYMSVEETQQLNSAWTRVLEAIVVVKEDTHLPSSLQEDILTIVQLSDKQHGSWIPEAAQRFQTVCTHHMHVLTDYLTSLSSISNNKRERILLQKLVAEMLGTRAIETSPVISSFTDNSHHSQCNRSIQAAHALLRDRREELEIVLANESMARFQQSSSDSLAVLHLPEAPYWVDSIITEEFRWLEEAMLECNIAAMDTEWYTRLDDGTVDVATLQIAIPGRTRPWVLDLLSESLDFQEKAKQLVQRVLFDESRIVLGFAMGNDLPKIETWLGSELSRNTCLDVQMLHTNGGDQLKGLASIVQLYSDLPLSKTEQCSSWSDRPLSRAQMEYAGLDAAILPVLVAEWMRQPH